MKILQLSQVVNLLQLNPYSRICIVAVALSQLNLQINLFMISSLLSLAVAYH